ncbi:hypothetical protein V8G57_17090 [Collimonas sp. H4R21]|uniref:Uncharacterized protein n=1 Tax=Collimonas rhizosphaerae TaxID=3126357 RepID=A0ABU9PYM2_9BURK
MSISIQEIAAASAVPDVRNSSQHNELPPAAELTAINLQSGRKPLSVYTAVRDADQFLSGLKSRQSIATLHLLQARELNMVDAFHLSQAASNYHVTATVISSVTNSLKQSMTSLMQQQ